MVWFLGSGFHYLGLVLEIMHPRLFLGYTYLGMANAMPFELLTDNCIMKEKSIGLLVVCFPAVWTEPLG